MSVNLEPRTASLDALRAEGWQDAKNVEIGQSWPASVGAIVEKDGRAMRSDWYSVYDDYSDWPGSAAAIRWWPIELVEVTRRHVKHLAAWPSEVGQ